jgi:predicted TIM-barrel fold metal-dependent hydrolase
MNSAPRPRPSRRDFLRTTAAAAVASQLSLPAAGADPRAFIDAHSHVWTPDTQRYPRAAAFATKKAPEPRSFTPEELFEHCQPEGVTRVVLIQMSFYQFDNRYMLDAIAAHPRVFRGVAVVDENARVTDTMRRLVRAGVTGFRLYADQARAEAWLDSAPMQAMWTQAADAGLAMCPLANPDALPAIRRMCERFPHTRVVIDHCARIGAREPVNDRDLDRLCRLAEFEHVHVKTSAFYALGAKKAPYTDLAPMIRRLRNAFGAARLMWASDCPFQVQNGHTYAASIALIRDRLDFLSADDKAWLLRNTAEKVYFG